MNSPIQSPISAEKFTNFLRVAKLENFVIHADKNMTQQVSLQYVNEQGVPLVEVIAEDKSFSDEQREALLAQYKDRIVTRQTRDAWIDPQTGAVVSAGTEGAITQLQYFQAITIGELKKRMPIDDSTSFAEILYALLTAEIVTMDGRGQL